MAKFWQQTQLPNNMHKYTITATKTIPEWKQNRFVVILALIVQSNKSLFKFLLSFYEPFNVWCPLNSHMYLNKLAAESRRFV